MWDVHVSIHAGTSRHVLVNACACERERAYARSLLDAHECVVSLRVQLLMWVYDVRVCACMKCVRACVHVRVCMHVCVCMCVRDQPAHVRC